MGKFAQLRQRPHSRRISSRGRFCPNFARALSAGLDGAVYCWRWFSP
ncbi:MAG: hypothetical protein IPL33_20885 [Sphingobacteriales bacterium]|nr:hypothetical protein [Sphingobacteriales bacterium]